jgi:hypothetical protein
LFIAFLHFIPIVFQKLVFSFAGIPVFKSGCIAPAIGQGLLRRRLRLI